MLLTIVGSLGIRVFGGTFASVEPLGMVSFRSRTPAGNSENCPSFRLTEHAENVAATAREPESDRRDGPVASATVAATVCSEYWGHFVSVGVESCREPCYGRSRQTFERRGKR